MASSIETKSPLVRANLAFRLLLEVAMLAGIAVASMATVDGATTWVMAVVGVVLAATLWGVFAVPNDPSRSGNTVVATPGIARLALELGLFVGVTAWLAVSDVYIYAALLGSGTVLHYAPWPARIRWLLTESV